MGVMPMTYRNMTIRLAPTPCGRCGRELTDPESIRAGMGPICRALVMAERNGGNVDDFAKRDEFSDKYDDTIPFSEALVLRRVFGSDGAHEDGLGGVYTNVPHLVVHHSPDGFEFGYGGSGPADLALNACQLYLNMMRYEGRKMKCYDGNCWTLAWALHQEFKNVFLIEVPRKGKSIPFELIHAWFEGHMTPAMLAQYQNFETEEEEK